MLAGPTPRQYRLLQLILLVTRSHAHTRTRESVSHNTDGGLISLADTKAIGVDSSSRCLTTRVSDGSLGCMTLRSCVDVYEHSADSVRRAGQCPYAGAYRRHFC
jgi:hypothetical protein